MKLTIDENKKILIKEVNNEETIIPLYSKEAFELVSNQWIKIGWNQKYSYTFTWLGRPIIQLPEDMFRIQELIYKIKPDVIIETGIAHGGSIIFYASLCKLMGNGRVLGIDIDIRDCSRQIIERHELKDLIYLIEGSSIEDKTLETIRSMIKENEKVFVILDSCHTKSHVLRELEEYGPLVTPDSYIIATDGIMRSLYDVPGGNIKWKQDNPSEAVEEFLKAHDEFVLDSPSWIFNESSLDKNVTYWPNAWLKRR